VICAKFMLLGSAFHVGPRFSKRALLLKVVLPPVRGLRVVQKAWSNFSGLPSLAFDPSTRIRYSIDLTLIFGDAALRLVRFLRANVVHWCSTAPCSAKESHESGNSRGSGDDSMATEHGEID